MKRLLFTSLVGACAILVAAGAACAQTGADANSAYEHFCSANNAQPEEGHLADMLAKRLVLDDAQKAAFKEWRDARRSARENMTTTICASHADTLTFEGRLALHQKFLQARLAAMEIENPKLIAFYKTLDATQKETVDGVRKRWRRQHDRRAN